MEWFPEECHRASTRGLSACLRIVVSCQDDRGDGGTDGVQMLQELQATHPAQAQIEDQAAGVHSVGRLKEVLGGRERLDPESHRRQEIPEGTAK